MKIIKQKLASLLGSFFTPLPELEARIWSGNCACCGRDIWSSKEVFPDGVKVECIGCAKGLTEASKKRIEERRQIDHYKQAVHESREFYYSCRNQRLDLEWSLVKRDSSRLSLLLWAKSNLTTHASLEHLKVSTVEAERLVAYLKELALEIDEWVETNLDDNTPKHDG